MTTTEDTEASKDKAVPEGVITELFLHPPGYDTPISVEQLKLEIDRGIQGDKHSGSRFSDIREKTLMQLGFRKGTHIANMRHITAISVEELAEISRLMLSHPDLPAIHLEPNIVLEGIEGLSQLPAGTLLSFGEKRSAIFAVWDENSPCPTPHKNIKAAFPDATGAFASVARHRRGVVGFVYCGGPIKVGDPVYVHPRAAR